MHYTYICVCVGGENSLGEGLTIPTHVVCYFIFFIFTPLLAHWLQRLTETTERRDGFTRSSPHRRRQLVFARSVSDRESGLDWSESELDIRLALFAFCSRPKQGKARHSRVNYCWWKNKSLLYTRGRKLKISDSWIPYTTFFCFEIGFRIWKLASLDGACAGIGWSPAGRLRLVSAPGGNTFFFLEWLLWVFECGYFQSFRFCFKALGLSARVFGRVEKTFLYLVFFRFEENFLGKEYLLKL